MARNIRILWILLEVNQLLWVLLLANNLLQAPHAGTNNALNLDRLLVLIGFLFATGAQIWAYNVDRRVHPQTTE
ncbi:MAG: hypothetical protein H6819_12240 [Phycisphaerales bacterium]|nr:hypothetical protein [Phycisphaerales bacterium]MCB9857530.1 hypothetical protein [Phycisphaerales bacterium]MCB9864485.1 hypothetical protein [Phycisphaerales bacterium]